MKLDVAGPDKAVSGTTGTVGGAKAAVVVGTVQHVAFGRRADAAVGAASRRPPGHG